MESEKEGKRQRLKDYGLQHGSTVFLVLRLQGGSDVPPPKELDDAVELSDAPDMITWDDDPENKRAKMQCGHAISKKLLSLETLFQFNPSLRLPFHRSLGPSRAHFPNSGC